MSKHVWLIKRFEQRTIDEGIEAIKWCMHKGMDYEASCRFSGYLLESGRQKSGRTDLIETWLAAMKSIHRYANGKNRENYRIAGERVLELDGGACVGLEGAPPQAVWDKMMEDYERDAFSATLRDVEERMRKRALWKSEQDRPLPWNPAR